MLRTLALLCLFAASALGVWEGALKVTFGLSIFGIGSDVFVDLPQSEREALSQRWVHVDRPEGPEGLEVLELWCSVTDYTVCVLLDDTGYIAGLQIAIDEDQFSDGIYDWNRQGFTYWTVTDQDGVTKNYWTAQQYYISAESLTIDAETRIANRDSYVMLQDEAIWVSSFNGTLYAIPTDVSQIAAEGSDFTEQACIPWMGLHYYYKMTTDLECSEDTLLPWFPLVDDGQLIGVGMIVFGKHDPGDNHNWFEEPNSIAVKAIVPTGPECLYELADTPGLVTLHTYFIRHPYRLTCLF